MPLLKTVLPGFAADLSKALEREGHKRLAMEVATTRIEDWCRCELTGCVTFFAVPKAEAPPGTECDRLIPEMVGVDCIQFHSGRIIWIEALDRPHDRRRLLDFEKKHGKIGTSKKS